MPRGLDHAVHAVHDLDEAAQAWVKLGFQVGGQNTHPFGTKNRLIQFPGFFVELLAIDDDMRISEHGPRRYSFAAFNRDFLNDGEGLSMLVVATSNAEDCAAEFRNQGLGDFDTFAFEREGLGPEGTPVHVAFRLAFAQSDQPSGAGFFACEQVYPENFWNPDFQVHANGVTGISAAIFTADNPTDHHIFLSAFADIRDIKATSSGITLSTPRGAIEVLSPSAFADRYGEETGGSELRFRALRFRVPDLGTTEQVLRQTGAAHSSRRDMLVVPAKTANGAVLAFEGR